MSADETLQRALGDVEGQQLVAKILERKAQAEQQAGMLEAELLPDATKLREAMDRLLERPLFDVALHERTKLEGMRPSAFGALGNHLLSLAAAELFEELGHDGVEQVAKQALEQRPQLSDLVDAVVRNRVAAETAQREAAHWAARKQGCGVVERRDLNGTLLSVAPDPAVPRDTCYVFNGTPEELAQEVLRDGIKFSYDAHPAVDEQCSEPAGVENGMLLRCRKHEGHAGPHEV